MAFEDMPWRSNIMVPPFWAFPLKEIEKIASCRMERTCVAIDPSKDDYETPWASYSTMKTCKSVLERIEESMP
jgi:hypothetical protein